MTINSDIRNMTLSIPVKELAQLLALAQHHEVVVEHLRQREAKIVRMKKELTNYQAKFERLNAKDETPVDKQNLTTEKEG